MSFGTAHRSRLHVMGDSGGEFVPRWRVTAPCVVAKSLEGRLQHCYHTELTDHPGSV
jgi:hypothetical protein